MAKKSFKDNPALQFISVAAVPGLMEQQDTQGMDNTHNTHDTQNTEYTHNAHNKHGILERKTKRLNLLMRPSLLRDVAKIAHMRRQSVNDLINTALDEYRAAHPGEIDEYDRVFGE